MPTKSLRYEGLPNLAIAEGATVPNPGLIGVRAWSTTLARVMYWDGSKWSSFQPSIIVSATAPSSPYVGQLWFDIS